MKRSQAKWAAVVTWVLVGLLSFWRGWSYLWPGAQWSETSTRTQALYNFATDNGLPFWVYGYLWLVAGVIAFGAAASVRLRPLAVGINVGLYFMWTVSSVAAWLDGQNERGWISGLSYLVLGWLVFVVNNQRVEVQSSKPVAPEVNSSDA